MIRHVFQAVIWYRYDIVNAVDSNMIHYGYAVMDKLEKKIVYNDPDRLGSTHTRKVMAKFYNEEEMYLHNLYQYAIDGK